jgi:peroxiredoxin Q/BCP
MAIEVGKKAPSFSLPDENGNVVKLSEFKGRRLVVFFFPKAMTPG